MNPNANGYRLPSPSEWTYAAKGGTNAKCYFADASSARYRDDYVWGAANCDETQPVGQKMPNQFGLFDVLGNVSEICWGWTDHEDDRHEERETLYGYRGGSFGYTLIDVKKQSKRSFATWLDNRFNATGFRVVSRSY